MESTKHFRKRDAILRCVRQTDIHPSADWVHAQLRREYPDISLGTVYRNLSLFKQQGLICSLGTVSGVERFDGDTSPHVHFICSQCDSVIDLPELAVPQSLRVQAQTQSGGQISACQLTFTGRCRRCQSEDR